MSPNQSERKLKVPLYNIIVAFSGCRQACQFFFVLVFRTALFLRINLPTLSDTVQDNNKWSVYNMYELCRVLISVSRHKRVTCSGGVIT